MDEKGFVQALARIIVGGERAVVKKKLLFAGSSE